jgi:primary-amine oxidase
MQEALAVYAANDPERAQTYYLDTTVAGFGEAAQTLVPGWDCPETASYLDTPYVKGGICIFERDAGFPLSRHKGEGYVTVVKNHILVLRTITTLGNYDYLVEYQFFYDGSIEVTVRASGYIEGTNAGGNEEFGYRIHDALSGAMHDHVINFKIDLDVNGTANTLERVDVKPVTAPFTGSKAPINTMHTEKTFITNEDHSKLDWAPNAASMFVVVNKDAKNPFGEYRGYRIAPGVGSPAHNTMQNSSVLLNGANWSKNHFYVTKRKETELRSTSYMNTADLEDPFINFDKFFDGENIEQEDL